MARLNGELHQRALAVFAVIVAVHWAEHLAQLVEIHLLGWTLPEARGVVGVALPWLVTSELMHYGYAIVMLVGFALLLPGFEGRSRTWWKVALAIQAWHQCEHLILMVQYWSADPWFGQAKPTSLVQLVVPRVELHVIYNSIVTVPMMVAMFEHRYPKAVSSTLARCTCARTPVAVHGLSHA